MSSTNKRKVFDRIHALEEQDLQVFKRKRSDRERSLAAQSQNQVYQRLVECRILLQRSLDKPSVVTSTAAVAQCDTVLEKLLQARQSLLQQSATKEKETREEQLAREYDECRESWKEVLDRRHKDARLHAGATQKFKALDASFFDQVDSAVQHEKSKHRQAGSAFDDSKVYQQMLKDFLSQSSPTDQRFAAAASKKKTAKKIVDRKASKGRKIRYAEIPKLVHFTFPIARPETELETDTWLRSLFGGAIHQTVTKK